MWDDGGSFRKSEEIQEQTYEVLSERKIIARQVLTFVAPFVIVVVKGLNAGFSSTLLPELKESNVGMTEDDASWIASITILAMPFGAFFGSACLEKLGRKRTNMLSYPVFSLAWLMFLISDDVGMIMTSRFFTGLASGFTLIPVGVYLVEVIHPKYRGMFLVLISTGTSVGVLIIHAINIFVNWKVTALVSACIPIICLVTMSLSPDSPQWLIKHNRIDEAKAAFYWLRGFSEESKEELSKLMKPPEPRDLNQQGNIFKDMIFYKTMSVVFIYNFIAQLSGFNSIEYYSVGLAKETFGGNEYEITILLDVVRIFFSFVSCILCKKINRRPHTIWTTFGAGISIIILAILLAYKSSVNGVVMLVFLLAYISFITAGISHLEGVVTMELVPYRMRGIGLGITLFFICLSAFVVVKLSPLMMVTFGMVAGYSFYGVSCIVGILILYYILPETKDKSLIEIEELFKK